MPQPNWMQFFAFDRQDSPLWFCVKIWQIFMQFFYSRKEKPILWNFEFFSKLKKVVNKFFPSFISGFIGFVLKFSSSYMPLFDRQKSIPVIWAAQRLTEYFFLHLNHFFGHKSHDSPMISSRHSIDIQSGCILTPIALKLMKHWQRYSELKGQIWVKLFRTQL